MSAQPCASQPGVQSGIESERCKDLYRRLTSGVAVVTADGPSGAAAMTASSVLAVSLRPPLLLISLANASATLAALRDSGRFAVTVLGDGQQHLAERFASARPAWAKLSGVPLVESAPAVPAGALAAAVCDVTWTAEAGDHTLVLGEVRRTMAGAGRPLVWHGSAYHRLAAPAAS